MIDIDAIRPKLKTQPATAFFWSGRTDGIGGAENAANIAKSRGVVTLESTIEIKNIVMSELAPLISDLALILICAGIMTLIFKRLRQPLVLGYIVAGFLASPHMPYTPSVIDTANIHTWSDIGVIFLLFALVL